MTPLSYKTKLKLMSNFNRPTQKFNYSHESCVLRSKVKKTKKDKRQAYCDAACILDFSLKMSLALHLGLFCSSADCMKSAMSYANFGINISFKFK